MSAHARTFQAGRLASWRPSWRLGVGLGAGVIAALGAIGWMHTPSGLRVLAALGVPCPVNSVPVERVEALRQHGVAPLRMLAPAPARPTPGGLALDRTTEAQAATLLAHAHGQCEAQVRGYHYLRCRGIDASALALAGPPVSELWLSFNGAGRLIGIDIYRRGMQDGDVRATWADATGRLQSALGKPQVAFGDASPAVLAATPIQTARVQYRYADYVATVTASHLPQSGLSVREQYMSSTL
ncbi:hypothetical protein [Massilia sp. 9096]|uniref:hypothetical protein n=1 Tax=Massilia sp. 9096 TaxID=1500894 RepID=UPI001EFBB6C1|nr:hypothetical protein [Massilia sp. 9096]